MCAEIYLLFIKSSISLPRVTATLYTLFYFSIYEIYCQIGFHTTPSAHPKRCPPQYPSLPTPINLHFVLRFEESLMVWLSPSLFFSLPLPHGVLLSFSGST